MRCDDPRRYVLASCVTRANHTETNELATRKATSGELHDGEPQTAQTSATQATRFAVGGPDVFGSIQFRRHQHHYDRRKRVVSQNGP
jgi:hypothetical protein